MLIAFHCQQLGVRGTEVATYDYAHYNELLLGNRSLIIVPKDSPHTHPHGITKFTERFKVIFYHDISELDGILVNEGVDLLYVLKAGFNDGIFSTKIKTVIHSVFRYNDPHGDVYAYISKWLSQELSEGKHPYVPHMIQLPEIKGDMRVELGIPSDALVFARYGGLDTFDLHFARQAVYEVAKKKSEIYFLFMNTEEFIGGRLFRKRWFNKICRPIIYPIKSFKNIIFLPPTSSMEEKVKFINTSDAMLHARGEGETFGIACGEFSIKNKPVITWNTPQVTDKCHIQNLGDKGIYYANKKELKDILLTFKPQPKKNWDAFSDKFNPQEVMKKFKEVFIDKNNNFEP